MLKKCVSVMVGPDTNDPMKIAAQRLIFYRKKVILADPDGWVLDRCYWQNRGDVVLSSTHEYATREFSPAEYLRSSRYAGTMVFMPFKTGSSPAEVAERQEVVDRLELVIEEALRCERRADLEFSILVNGADCLGRIGRLSRAAQSLRAYGGQLILGMTSREKFMDLYGSDAQGILAQEEACEF